MKPSDATARVLVVDDDPNTLAALARLLAPEFDVLVARSGREALRLVRRDPPDLVLLDVEMPELDGLAVCRQLKADALTEEVPVVFLTSHGDEASEVEGLAAGAADFITKPPRAAVVRARVRNLVRMKHLAECLRQEAQTDALTGLANRARLMRTLGDETLRARRHRQPLSLLMIDVDHFKAYNDHYGHLSGDGALRQIAQALQQAQRRAGDLAARYGGEEFALLLPGTGAAGAAAVAKGVLAVLAERPLAHANSPTAPWVTVSIGLATLLPAEPSPATDNDLALLDGSVQVTDLIARADAALYAAKRGGRNRVWVADAEPPAAGLPQAADQQGGSA